MSFGDQKDARSDERGHDSNGHISLRISYTSSASASVAQILIRLDDLDPDYADRFQSKLETALSEAARRVAVEIAEAGRPFDLPDYEASAYWSQPIYRLRIETTKRRARRSSGGLWYAFYSLRDTDDDGVPDVLRVHVVRHSAASPLSFASGEDDAE